MEKKGVPGSDTQSHASDRLLANKERILATWEKRVRSEVAAAEGLSEPVLINTLPALLRQMAEAVSDSHPRRTATEGSTVAEEHGGERARITNFQIDDLIREYAVLRAVVFEIVEEGGPLTLPERSTLHASIDQAIVKSCTAYALVEAGLREQIFATLAHDLRGPLGAAKVNVGMILRKPADEQIARWAVRASDGIDRVDRMLQDLLDAMRVQTGGRLWLDLEACDLVEVVRQAVENQRAEHGDRFVFVAPEPVPGYFAPAPLTRAIENLVTNAVKYGTASRAITITVRESHQRAFVVVHNHGGAIPVEKQEMLFRAFQRLPEAESGGRRGWGLGLAQVRGTAEAHGGSIAVDSLPERGTSFTIDIPVDARPFQSKPTTPRSDESRAGETPPRRSQ